MSTDIHFVAQKARKTFMAIRKLRKTMPQFTRHEKNALAEEIKKHEDQWWKDVEEKFVKDDNVPPFTEEKIERLRDLEQKESYEMVFSLSSITYNISESRHEDNR